MNVVKHETWHFHLAYTKVSSSIYSKTCVFWVKRQQHASSIIFLQWCIAASIRFGTKSTTTSPTHHSARGAFICPVCATKKKYQSKCFLYLFVGERKSKNGAIMGFIPLCLNPLCENITITLFVIELSVALLITGDKKKTGEEVPIERCKWWNYWRKLNRNAGLET